MKHLLQSAAFALMLVPSWGVAEPSRGYLRGTNDFIQYSCSKLNEMTLECEFIQVALQLSAKPEDLVKRLSKLDEALDEFLSDAGETEAMCGDAVQLPLAALVRFALNGETESLKALGDRLPDFDADEFVRLTGEMHPRALEDLIQQMDALDALCDGITREKVEGLIRLEYEQQARTCKLWINPWKETFERVSNHVWSIQSPGPRGECGIVRLDRFECEENYPSLCNFTSEKRVLNKDGGSILPCSGWDETVYEYSWKGDDLYLDCTIIGFP